MFNWISPLLDEFHFGPCRSIAVPTLRESQVEFYKIFEAAHVHKVGTWQNMHPISIMIYSLNLKQFFDFMQVSEPVVAWERENGLGLFDSFCDLFSSCRSWKTSKRTDSSLEFMNAHAPSRSKWCLTRTNYRLRQSCNLKLFVGEIYL
jgi:hypothetical protein